MAVKDILVKTVKDYFSIFFGFLARNNPTTGNKKLISVILSSLFVASILGLVIAFPFLEQNIFKHGSKAVHLNIFEVNTGVGYTNQSYLCKFDLKRLDDTILNFTMSNDTQEIVISFPEGGDIKKKNCKPYELDEPYNDWNFDGTIINIFYSNGMQYYLNSTHNRKNMLIRSANPLRVFIRNRNALLVHPTNLTASLMKDAVQYEHRIERVKSKDKKYYDFTGLFKFQGSNSTGIYGTFKKPQVYLYETPSLEEVNFTTLADFQSSEREFKVNFAVKGKNQESRKTFLQVVGEMSTNDADFAWMNGLTISKYEYIDPSHKSNFKRSLGIAAWVGGVLGSLFVILLASNFVLALFSKKKVQVVQVEKTVEKKIVEEVELSDINKAKAA